MRSLNGTLLAAQKKASGVPYVQVQVRERIGNVTRLTWERLYTGGESDFFHAATMPGDGSLVRARVNPSTNQLLVQRVASPGPGADFSAWSPLAGVSAVASIALTGNGASVLLFYVDTDNLTIKLAESGNYGQSFGGAVTVATASGAVGWLAAALKSDGTALLIYSVGATVYRVKRGGGSWGPAAAWSNSVAGVSGLTCCYFSDFNVVVTGSDAAGAAKVWTTIYGDGFNQPLNTWSGLSELSRADAGSNVTFSAPFLDWPDRPRMLFVEKYGGSQAYARPLWSHVSPLGDFPTGTWREPVPFEQTGEYGAAIAHSAAYAWLSTPGGVWRAPLGGAPLDLSDDVLALEQEIAPFDGRVRIVLRNDDGRYSDLTSGGIRLSSQVDVSPGYLASDGRRVSSGSRYWIEGWQYDCRAGKSTFTLLARDGWWLLSHWRARREYSWNAGEKSVSQILGFMLARAGLEYACLSNSAVLDSLRPSFAIHPSEDGLTGVRRLLQMAPDVVRMAGETAQVINPLPDQAVDYAYGDGSGHALLQGCYAVPDRGLNRAQVFGQGVMVDAFDWPSIGSVYDRLAQAYDLNLTSAADAQSRADALLRREAMASLAGEVVVPVNCGQELYDVVALTDARAGLSAAHRRVMGLSLRYARDGAGPVYEMRLRLGAV